MQGGKENAVSALTTTTRGVSVGRPYDLGLACDSVLHCVQDPHIAAAAASLSVTQELKTRFPVFL